MGHCLPSLDTGGTGSVWGSRTSAHVYEQIKNSQKLKYEMWLFRKIKETYPDYKRIHCMEWLREQIGDYEAEQVRISVRSGVLEGDRDGTDVPGGAGT